MLVSLLTLYLVLSYKLPRKVLPLVAGTENIISIKYFINSFMFLLVLLGILVSISIYIGSLKFGGDKEIRTPDLLRAKQALYQLSYIPINC
jgi:hypothetical protein